MADRACRWRWAAVVVCLVVSLAGCTALTAGPQAARPAPAPAAVAEPSSGPPTPAGGPPDAPVRVLQMNLCNSGIAGCYTGRSIDEAAEVIRAETPDLVTLNEICDGDVSELEQALADVVPGGGAVSAFQAARDGITGDPYQCRNGQQFGIGIVSRWPSMPGSSADSGIYRTQDPEDPEERAWLCLDVAASSAVSVCTTHLAYTDRDVTVAQCEFLFDTVIAGKRAQDGAAPLVLAADLNLGTTGNPDLEACLPSDSVRADDDRVQHMVATPEFVVDSARNIDMRDTTDHPGLLVTLAPQEGS